jgi:hypothetical protein
MYKITVDIQKFSWARLRRNNMQQKVSLTSEQAASLADLDELIAFGNAKLVTTASDLNRISRLGDRKKLLLALSLAIHSHVSSVAYLLKDCRVHSSEVLMRSVLEGYVNAAYIISMNNDSRAANYMLTEEQVKLGNYQKMQKYRKDNPKYNTEQTVYTDEDILKGIERETSIIDNIKHKYPDAAAVSLKAKIKAIDDKFSQRNQPYRPMEWSYFHTYHILCKSSHVTFDSLFSLFERKDKELAFYMGGNPKRIALLTLSAYVFYLDMLNMFLPRFGGKSSNLKQFDDALERLKKLA